MLKFWLRIGQYLLKKFSLRYLSTVSPIGSFCATIARIYSRTNSGFFNTRIPLKFLIKETIKAKAKIYLYKRLGLLHYLITMRQYGINQTLERMALNRAHNYRELYYLYKKSFRIGQDMQLENYIRNYLGITDLRGVRNQKAFIRYWIATEDGWNEGIQERLQEMRVATLQYINNFIYKERQKQWKRAQEEIFKRKKAFTLIRPVIEREDRLFRVGDINKIMKFKNEYPEYMSIINWNAWIRFTVKSPNTHNYYGPHLYHLATGWTYFYVRGYNTQQRAYTFNWNLGKLRDVMLKRKFGDSVDATMMRIISFLKYPNLRGILSRLYENRMVFNI